MSSLQPTGIPIVIGGVERRFLFTLAVIDEVQSTYDLPISKVIDKLADAKDVYPTLQYLALTLINDEIARNNYLKGTDDPLVTEQELKWMITLEQTADVCRAILRAYGYSLPDDDNDEDEDPNVTRSRSS